MVQPPREIQLSQRNFDVGITCGMIVLGAVLLLFGWAVIFVWIPRDPMGLWQSADGWIKESTIRFLAGGMLIGAVFLIVGLRRRSTTRGQNKPGYSEPIVYPAISLRLWALGQAIAAALVLLLNFRVWYNISILGGPSGFMHHVPLPYLLLSLLIEIPTLVLAQKTWENPRPIYWQGWLAIGAAHLLAFTYIIYLPWVVPLSPYAAPLWTMVPPVEKMAEGIFGVATILGIIPLISTFTMPQKMWSEHIQQHYHTSIWAQEDPPSPAPESNILLRGAHTELTGTIRTQKSVWLILPIIGTCLLIASTAFICWGIQMHLHYIPLLHEFPVYGDELETTRKSMAFAGVALLAGLVFLSLGILQYLQDTT